MYGIILTASNDIGSQQAKPIENTKIEADWLLNDLHTHPNEILMLKASDMVLWVDSDASYLVKPNVKSVWLFFIILARILVNFNLVNHHH